MGLNKLTTYDDMLIDFLLSNGTNIAAGVLKSYLMAASGSFTVIVVYTLRKVISTLITIFIFQEPISTLGLVGTALTMTGSLMEFIPDLLSKPVPPPKKEK